MIMYSVYNKILGVSALGRHKGRNIH